MIPQTLTDPPYSITVHGLLKFSGLEVQLSCVSRNDAAAMYDLIDPTRRNAYILGKSVLTPKRPRNSSTRISPGWIGGKSRFSILFSPL